MDPSQSFTVFPYINPPCGAFDAMNATSTLDNNFTVSQSFGAGIVDAGNLSVAGSSLFVGECVFSSIPRFNAGIIVELSEVDTGTLVVMGQSTLHGGLIVEGIVELPAGTINQSEVLSGYTDLLNAQSIAGIKTFSDVPVLSGASIISNTIDASSIVDSTISSVKILPAGIVQASIESGYVDLATTQIIAGDKEFTGATRLVSGLTVIGNTAMDQLQCGQVYASAIDVNGNVSATTFTGALNGNATSATLASTVNILTDNSAGSYFIPFVKSNVGSDSLYIDDVTVPILTYNPSVGSLSTASLTSTATATFKNVVLPTDVTVCTSVSGVLTIPLGGFSLGNFSHLMNANISSIAFTGLIVGSRSVLVLTGGTTTRTLQKNTSSGGISILNSLSGNTNISSGSTWICNIYVISATKVSMVWANIT
jgi:hypothetical protein